MQQVIMRLPQVTKAIGLARSTIYKRVAAGTFPKPIRLGPRAVGWLVSEIEQWIADRVAESRRAPE